MSRAAAARAPRVETPTVGQKRSGPSPHRERRWVQNKRRCVNGVGRPARVQPPRALRSAVWDRYIRSAEGFCYICRLARISWRSFECAHVISHANGGETNVNNLRPACQECNRSQGTQDMREFARQYGFWDGLTVEQAMAPRFEARRYMSEHQLDLIPPCVHDTDQWRAWMPKPAQSSTARDSSATDDKSPEDDKSPAEDGEDEAPDEEEEEVADEVVEEQENSLVGFADDPKTPETPARGVNLVSADEDSDGDSPTDEEPESAHDVGAEAKVAIVPTTETRAMPPLPRRAFSPVASADGPLDLQRQRLLRQRHAV